MRKRFIALASLAPTLAMMALAAEFASAASCESLVTLVSPETTVTSAQIVEAGQFSIPLNYPFKRMAGQAIFKESPAFCRVSATLKPSTDSDIKIEVWLPLSGWNGKYLAAGNGGWAGSINYAEMSSALQRGYATSSTDTGHTGTSVDASFALGHPEKQIDFVYRSEHEMTVKAKSIIAAFYGNAPRYSYWKGCSDGGRQALMEVQNYPADYDGVIAGAPDNNATHVVFSGLWTALAKLQDPGSFIPPEKYAAMHNAALAACDKLDTIEDGVIDDPTRCHFDPKSIECKEADDPSCLTAAQVESARKIYSGPKNPRTGEQIYPGLEPGSELGWGIGGTTPSPMFEGYFKYVLFQDPNWDFRSLNFDSHVTLADKTDGHFNATNKDLSPFFVRGGKLIQYHGWNDTTLAPRESIRYYQDVMKTMREPTKTADSYRLFMVPGMGHCGGGEGPNSFDAVTALEQWVEKGKAPDQIIASHSTNGKVDRSRPLCPYPQMAAYKGLGSTDDAANFACKAP